MSWGEHERWLQGELSADFYQEALDEASDRPARDRGRRKVIRAHELPWENSPHGLLKHLANAQMDLRIETIDAYMQVIPPGSNSGRHRQLAEQAFYVLEGRGYDLHVDCDVEITDTYHWRPQDVERRFDWEAGDVVYVPPNTISRHYNADRERVARIVVVTNRIYRQCGLNDLEQLETAPEYRPGETLTAERVREYVEAARTEFAT
ncbi:MAG: cupin domain-containing protein [Thermoleophilia bacterium]